MRCSTLGQMEKVGKRLTDAGEWLRELKRRRLFRGGEAPERVELTQYVPEKRRYTDDMETKVQAAERKRAAEAPRQTLTHVIVGLRR